MTTLTNSGGVLVVIPARFASSRFPGKPLAILEGKSVLRRCFEQVCQVVDPTSVVVATDDSRIAEECTKHEMRFKMTSAACLTGTDRVAEVARNTSYDWYVNVQGDEPFLDPSALTSVLNAIDQAPDTIGVINTHAEIADEDDFRSATVPKVVTDQRGRLLYISRAAIPTGKSLQFHSATRQVGLYAFRSTALQLFTQRGSKTPLEEIEDVEILRFLEMGVEVQMILVNAGGIAIDTPEDLERAKTFLRSNS